MGRFFGSKPVLEETAYSHSRNKELKDKEGNKGMRKPENISAQSVHHWLRGLTVPESRHRTHLRTGNGTSSQIGVEILPIKVREMQGSTN